MQLNTYLTFDGNCREAFEFYRSVFDVDWLAFQTFGEGPPDMDPPVPEDFRDRVMHCSIQLGDNTLMGSDTGPGQPAVVAGDNFSLSVSPDSREQCDALFAAMSDGGTVEMPLAEMFWGAYFGICRDRFGIAWMFNYELGG